ncbi:MAG: enoyl-CoA hydratase-related protein [Actinomycetota bacterium]|nr:enoyl-CoA hydratase-related protein [Actinomycetota bacterium]
MYQEITYSVEDPVGLITLNRPEVLNAMTLSMAAELRHAVYRAERDPAVVGIVITGAGRAFCAGADMYMLQDISGGDIPTAGVDLDLTPPHPIPADLDGEYTYLLGVEKPVIAAINGACAGMAVPIALCCDLRFMAEDAPLLTAFSQRGLIGEWGVAWLLPRLVGAGRALDLLFSSRRITGAEAAEMGVVNRALPADQVLPHAIDYVRQLAGNVSPASMAVIKSQVYQDLTATLGPAEKDARRRMMKSFASDDFKEGVASFQQKRPPRFSRLGRR